MCQFGASCTRPVCFFAHGEHQLRHTGMPGGPQPVVAPPEPNPALPGAGYNAVTDPVLKQQQQLIALQQAAAGFSSGQMRSDSLLPMVDPMQAAGQSYTGYLDAGGSMGMNALQREISNVSNYAHVLPASSPLSAPLPQLSPDLLAALSISPQPPAQQNTFSPTGLLHHNSSIPSNYHSAQLPDPTAHQQLQRSFTTLDNTSPAMMGELAKQLAVMQLMQQGGTTHTANMVNNGMDDSLMGQLAQLQQKQQQQVSATAGLDLESFLLAPATAGMLQQDSSFSCPLPPAYSNPGLASLAQAAPVSAVLPHISSASAISRAATPSQLPMTQMTVGSASPNGSEKDAPAAASRRDTQEDGSTASKKDKQVWSAPVSPCNSDKAGNDLLQAAHDIRMSSISFTTGGRSSPNASSQNTGSPSSSAAEENASALRLDSHGANSLMAGGLPSFDTAGIPAAQQSDSVPLLLIGDTPVQEGSNVQKVLTGGAGETAQQHSGMGKEKAAQLLGQLPESAVMKLLQLVAQQQ